MAYDLFDPVRGPELRNTTILLPPDPLPWATAIDSSPPPAAAANTSTLGSAAGNASSSVGGTANGTASSLAGGLDLSLFAPFLEERTARLRAELRFGWPIAGYERCSGEECRELQEKELQSWVERELNPRVRRAEPHAAGAAAAASASGSGNGGIECQRQGLRRPLVTTRRRTPDPTSS